MKNGFTAVWVVVKKGNEPRLFYTRHRGTIPKSGEIFGRFRSDDSDRLCTFTEIHTVKQEFPPVKPPEPTLQFARRRHLDLVQGKQPEAATATY